VRERSSADDDYALYRDLLAVVPPRRRRGNLGVVCLMPNHVHLILVPSEADGLRRALAPMHRRYAGVILSAIAEPALHHSDD
jgi:putative transposase